MFEFYGKNNRISIVDVLPIMDSLSDEEFEEMIVNLRKHRAIHKEMERRKALRRENHKGNRLDGLAK